MRAILFAVLLCGPVSVFAASFQDLNFEQYDPVSGILPGWTISNNNPFGIPRIPGPGSQFISLDAFVLDGSWATMISGNLVKVPIPDAGKYALNLSHADPRYPWIVTQTGDIPADAKIIYFDMEGLPLHLLLNGTELPIQFKPQSPSSAFPLREFADVSSFAGQTVTLEMTSGGALADVIQFSVIDNINFWPEGIPPVPEPSSIILIMIGVVVLRQCRNSTKW